MSKAFDYGIVLGESIAQRLRDRVAPLATYLHAKNRHLEAAPFMFNYIARLPNGIVRQGKFWEDYLQVLQDPELGLVKACAQSRLIEYAADINLSAAKEYHNQAASIYSREGCPAQMPGLALQHWRFVSAKLDKAADHDDSTKQPGGIGEDAIGPYAVGAIRGSDAVNAVAQSRLKELSAIHQQFIQQHLSQHLQITVQQAVELASSHPTLWSDTKEFMDSAIALMTENGNQLGIRELQAAFFMTACERLEYTEDARAFFEDLLTSNPDRLQPSTYAFACKGIWRCYNALNDHAKALKFAQMDYDSLACQRSEPRRTETVFRIALSRKLLVDARRDQADTATMKAFCGELEAIAALLEEWIELDRNTGRWGGFHEKSRQLTGVLVDLNNISKTKDTELRLEQHVARVSYLSKHEKSSPRSVDISPVLLMLTQRRFTDALAFTAREYDRVTKDPRSSFIQRAEAATTVGGTLMASAVIEPPLPSEERKQILQQQFEYLISDLEALQLTFQDHFLLRAFPLGRTVTDCLEFWPDQREKFLRVMNWYFSKAQAMCSSIRRSLLSERSMTQWMRSRTLGAGFSFKRICRVAAEFYLGSKCYDVAWSWIQRGRAQALQEMLTERATARERLLLSLKNAKGLSEELKEEANLVRQLEQAGSIHYSRARHRLEQHRSRMKQVQAIEQVIDGPEDAQAMHCHKIDDIWALKQYLPESCNIVLVDWFVDSMAVIWRLDLSYNERHLHPYWTSGYIRMAQIQQWKRDYLKFPNGRQFPLEKRYGALRELRTLLTGLENRCAPGDLIVISAPGEFSTIPIHGIPFVNDPSMPMIERNPVVYSGGLNLFRQCLARAQRHNAVRTASLLSDAYFVSAYEEAGHEHERAEIFAHLEATKNMFGSSTLLGEELTVQAINGALRSTPWVHYHGHAYYAKTEALNQCLVLGRLKDGERDIQSRMGAMSLEDTKRRFEADMPLEAPLSDREAMLSGHLLDGSSRLSVADVFAMDLSKTSPVVINIACDSGVQEFSPGDDPLGLVSALFCAGASSVLGTLWPIRSSAGRLFSEHFYKSLEQQEAERSRKPNSELRRAVNLAFAFREATLAVKRTNPAPYFWAPFVLQGAPLYFYGRSVDVSAEGVGEDQH